MLHITVIKCDKSYLNRTKLISFSHLKKCPPPPFLKQSLKKKLLRTKRLALLYHLACRKYTSMYKVCINI